MKQIVVLSGKGGTGKTTVTAALAYLAAQERKLVMADADVDAPNLALILGGKVTETLDFHSGNEAVIDAGLCIGCGRCQTVCRFDAIAPSDGVYVIDPVACEGCASCFHQCPAEAITMEPCQPGYWYRSETPQGSFFHAYLKPGQENSGKLVSTVRSQALEAANDQGADWLLIDGSPGVGCPVIAAVTGVDLALIVTEPTVSGIHDLMRVLGIADHFRVHVAVCINKADINAELTQQIEAFCAEEGIPVIARLPYDDVVTEAMRQGVSVMEVGENAVAEQITLLEQALVGLLGQ